jgi:hypothetical protein
LRTPREAQKDRDAGPKHAKKRLFLIIVEPFGGRRKICEVTLNFVVKRILYINKCLRILAIYHGNVTFQILGFWGPRFL